MNSFLAEMPEMKMPDFQCYGFCHKRLWKESKKEFTIHLKLFHHWHFSHVSWHVPLSCCVSIVSPKIKPRTFFCCFCTRLIDLKRKDCGQDVTLRSMIQSYSCFLKKALQPEIHVNPKNGF